MIDKIKKNTADLQSSYARTQREHARHNGVAVYFICKHAVPFCKMSYT